MSGGFNPAPFRFGASRHTAFETILKALLDGDGAGFSKDPNSYNYAEAFAFARALTDLWSANRRLSYQWDANRMTDFLPRWEAILGLTPLSTASTAARRAAVAAKLLLVGQPATAQVVHDLLVSVLGSIFVAIVNTTTANETAAVPGGITIPGGVTLPDGDWASSICFVAVQVSQPATMSDNDFYSTAGLIFQYLDGLLPAWVDFDWFRNGGSGSGFVLDDTFNLDNESFDS